MERTNKYEQIAQQLIARIGSGEFQPGDRLPAERILAQEYGVSRAVIREAVRSMAQIGCVESRVGGGSYVRTPDASSITDPFTIILEQDRSFAKELLETRLILEPGIARLAATRRTEEHLKALEHALKKMQTTNKCEQWDANFHEVLAQASGNRAMAMLIATCSEVVDRFVRITQSVEGVQRMAVEEHEKILDAIRRGDGDLAEVQMRLHLINAQENLKKTL